MSHTVSGNQPVWIGGIGTSTQWKWRDSAEAFVFTDWNSNVGNDPEQGLCVAKNSITGKWVPTNCVDEYSFVCESMITL